MTSPEAHGPEAHGPAAQGSTPFALADRILDHLAALCVLVAGVSLVCLIALFGWLVFGRYVLNDTPTWVEQMSLLLVVYITFLGAAAGVHHGTHLSIDFIREAFTGIPRQAMRYLADLTVLAFGGFMAWQGWLLVVTNSRRLIPMLGMAESWRAAPLAICGALMALFAAFHILRRLAGVERVGE